MAKALRVGIPGLAVVLFGYGMWLALWGSPPDSSMGDVARLMHVHVPAVWMALMCALMNFGACVWYLLTQNWKADAFAETSAEVGLIFGTYGVVLGALWGRPTWGVYWTWDPRLTSTAIMLVAYTGYLALRKFVDDPEKRATWASAVGILAGVDAPIVFFSVRWWKSLHQVQSTTQSIDKSLYSVWIFNAVALLFVMISFLMYRYRIAVAARQAEVTVPPEMPAQHVGLTPTGSDT
jgi:heme exporter protein C